MPLSVYGLHMCYTVQVQGFGAVLGDKEHYAAAYGAAGGTLWNSAWLCSGSFYL